MRVYNNPYNPYNNKNNKVAFGHNQGVIDALEKLQRDGSPSTLRVLQAQLHDIKFTPEFEKKLNSYPDYWKQVLVKYASPKEIQDGLKRVFGMK